MEARRILLISHLASPREVTGAERSLLELGDGMRRAGRDPVWVSPEPGRSADEARALGMPVHIRPWPRLWWGSWQAGLAASAARGARWLGGAPALARLRRELGHIGGNVALVNTLPNVGAAWAARRAGLGVVWRVAEIAGPGGRRWFFRRAVRRLAHGVVAVSRAVESALGEGTNAVVIPTGVAIPAAERVARARAELRARAGLEPDALVVACVGQIRPHKGQLEAVRAVAALGEAAPWLVIAGDETADPAYARRVRQEATRAGDRVRFAGFVPDASLGADVLVFPAIHPDPFPRVVLEAMAAAVPVVAFAGGGVEEAVRVGETGRIVATGDAAALRDAIGEFAASPAERARMGAAARERLARDFDPERALALYLDLIDRVARRD